MANTSERFRDNFHPVFCILTGRRLLLGLTQWFSKQQQMLPSSAWPLGSSFSHPEGNAVLLCSLLSRILACMNHILAVPCCDSLTFCIQQSLLLSLSRSTLSCSRRDETTFTPCNGFQPSHPPWRMAVQQPTSDTIHPNCLCRDWVFPVRRQGRPLPRAGRGTIM